MTGYSWSWKYNKKIFSGLLIVGGVFLLLEHLFTFGGFDFFDIVGHETIGSLMIFFGVLLSVKWHQIPMFIRAVKARDWKAILDEGEREKYENGG